jgi:hypothetical protein
MKHTARGRIPPSRAQLNAQTKFYEKATREIIWDESGFPVGETVRIEPVRMTSRKRGKKYVQSKIDNV